MKDIRESGKYLKISKVWGKIKFEQVINEEPLCVPYDPKCMQSWEWRNITFQDHTSTLQDYDFTWSHLRTATKASLYIKGAHNGIFVAHKWVIPLSWVTTHNVPREGRRIWILLYKATMRWRIWEHIVMLARIAQEVPAMCDPELKIEGTQLLAIQKFQSTTVERGRLCTEAILE